MPGPSRVRRGENNCFVIKQIGSICLLQIGNLFGKHRSTIITLYNGAFDSSSVVFLIIKVKIPIAGLRG